MHYTNWIRSVAGSGAILGLLNYFNSEKNNVNASWTTEFTSSTKWDYNWDKRDPSIVIGDRINKSSEEKENTINEEKEKLPRATRNLIFVRHGQYNLKGIRDYERCLTALGREQAEATGVRLKSLDIPLTKIIHSTMTRAKETASLICKHLSEVPVESCDMIREGAPCPVDPPVDYWKPDLSECYEDGAIIEAAFRKYFHRASVDQKANSFELFVCHANVIRYFVCRALQFPPEAWLRFALHHCSITWIRIHPTGRVSVYSIGDCGHLPPEKLTTS